eukprot:TRINITY_DN65660_c0_g1_i1.p1 TRINITY_DN65660_c0_g1~~TRINITY_DN65660_c0_g1_i1.p1  ORF type:complete len:540 (+),score=71.41 TRINITY_DN65660_c0_g1_i1:65-1684(+)
MMRVPKFNFIGAVLSSLQLFHVALAAHPKEFKNPTLAMIEVKSPDSIAGAIPGYFGKFSALPTGGDFEVQVPPENDDIGCKSYELPKSKNGRKVVALVRQGKCKFVDKALNAQKAGASGIIVAFNSDQVFVMGGNDTQLEDEVHIFAAAIGKTAGNQMRSQIVDTKQNALVTTSGGIVKEGKDGKEPVVLSVSIYEPSVLNISELFLILLATSLVAAGAFFSTSDMRQTAFSTAIAPQQEEVLEVDAMMAGSFCVMGSGMLVFLFFFMNYMIYVIIFAFCVGGASCITQFGSLAIIHFSPQMKKRVVDVPLFGPVSQAEMIAAVPASCLVIAWVTLRNTPYSWPFQDIIGAGFLCWMQRTLRLPNIRIATLLLTAMFFFDIFWVFISPLIFTKSVMVTVATGGDTGENVPMLLRIPTFGDPLGHDRLLGFGDIALPGLLVSYLRRHDIMSRRRFTEGYFFPSLIGYFLGLCVTIAALCIMKMGQPALLYLVPGTLGLTLVLSSSRGELQNLWDGRACSSCERDSSEETTQCQNDFGSDP